MWTQIVGKIRLAQSPWINHSWHAPLYVSARGLTTSLIPYPVSHSVSHGVSHSDRAFEIVFDFVAHRLLVNVSDGGTGGFSLAPMSVAAFYKKLLAELDSLGVSVRIHAKPNEVATATPFEKNTAHAAYDEAYVHRYWQLLVWAERVFNAFRARYLGKCSPVHLFWGGFDLAVTRFSGRAAPPHPGGVPNLPLWVTREAYSHEVSSCGFWPGSKDFPEPLFYSYAYPEPPGFAEAKVSPDASYNADLGEFILPYKTLREAEEPEATLLDFLQTTYEAAATLGDWDRAGLERTLDPKAVAHST